MGNDRAGVRASSATSIEISFYFEKARCRERIPWKPTPANLKKAQIFRASILQAIYEGRFVYTETFPDSPRAARFARRPGDVETIDRYMDDWVARKRKHVKASTYDGYRLIAGKISKRFLNVPLSDLKRKDVRDWLDTLKVSNKRLTNIQSVLRSALDDAVNDEMIEANPLAGWTYRIPEPPREEDDIDPFTADEQARILAAAGTAAERNLFQFAFWTGLRTSEIAAVRWGDVDWKREVIRIVRSWTTEAVAPEDTKTRAGRREVKLLRPALDALEAQKPLTLLADSEIFMNPRTGAPWRGKNPIWTAWGRAIRKAKVAYRKPYQTRHTYASMMLSAGEHPMWVARQMGHSSWVITARVYARWMPTADAEAGGKAVARVANDDAVQKQTTQGKIEANTG